MLKPCKKKRKKKRCRACKIPLSLAMIFIFSFSSSFAMGITTYSSAESEVANIFPFSSSFALSDNLLVGRAKSGKGFAFLVIFCFDSDNILVGLYHKVRGGKDFGVWWDFLHGLVSIFFERERERQINNFGDLLVVIIEVWLNFCIEE